MAKVFLGGTVNNSQWREELIPKLKVDFFNPVVEDWTEKKKKKELAARESCDFCLYVLTPKISSFYSIAEAIDDSNKRPKKTIFCFLLDDAGQKFSDFQIKSMKAIGKMVKENGGQWLNSIDEIAVYLNSKS